MRFTCFQSEIPVVTKIDSTDFPTASAFQGTFGGGICVDGVICFDTFVAKIGQPLTPAEAIQQLIADVVVLNLKQGISNSLDAKLDAAFQALDDLNENNDVAAINSIQAFINYVEAQRGIHISSADADALIASAQAIIASLGG